MRRVLFICTHNSARSQIAEGLLRGLRGDEFEAFSAGTEPGQLHPHAVSVMAEAGLDIAGQTAKGADSFTDQAFDFVITVCDEAKEDCPAFPGSKSGLHWSLPDPSNVEGGEAEQKLAFRSVRDRLIDLIDGLG